MGDKIWEQPWQNLIDVDLPESKPVTEKAREQTTRFANRFRGSVRIATGKFRTDREYEEYRTRVLNTPLP